MYANDFFFRMQAYEFASHNNLFGQHHIGCKEKKRNKRTRAHKLQACQHTHITPFLCKKKKIGEEHFKILFSENNFTSTKARPIR